MLGLFLFFHVNERLMPIQHNIWSGFLSSFKEKIKEKTSVRFTYKVYKNNTHQMTQQSDSEFLLAGGNSSWLWVWVAAAHLKMWLHLFQFCIWRKNNSIYGKSHFQLFQQFPNSRVIKSLSPSLLPRLQLTRMLSIFNCPCSFSFTKIGACLSFYYFPLFHLYSISNFRHQSWFVHPKDVDFFVCLSDLFKNLEEKFKCLCAR